jgi:hypothetical protein
MMAAAETTVVLVTDLTSVAATMTAVTTGTKSIILSANADSIILSTPLAESMILSMQPADATRKNTGTVL